MSAQRIDITYQLRRGTTAEWTAANPVLLAGEPGIDIVNGDFRVGDGSTHWADLDPVGVKDYADLAGKPTLGTAAATDATDYATAWASVYPDAARVTNGAYLREYAGFRALVVDPNVPGRVWGVAGSNIVYRDSDGTGTLMVAAANPADPQAIIQLTFTATHLFALTTGNGSRLGQLWRGTLPAADGTGITFAAPNGKMFDLTGGATSNGVGDGGAGSYFRCGGFAINGTAAYLVEYGDVVTGGPSVYYIANVFIAPASNYLWSKRKTWALAKHAHSVAVFGGVPWVMLGDAGAGQTDIGLWCATAAAGGTWNPRSIYGDDAGGNCYYGINMLGMSIGGVPVILAESDTKRGFGPLAYCSQSPTSSLPLMPLCEIPPPYKGTMRQLTLTAEGNLMWVTTGEGGAVGALDSIWMAAPPFTNPILLESFTTVGSVLGTLGGPVESGPYVFFGSYRIRKPTMRA